MPVITAADARSFALPGLAVLGLAAPSRGARETAVWRLTLEPGALGAAHTLDREEVFVALAGAARASIGDAEHEVGAGEALVVPAGVEFSLANPYEEPFEAVVAFPVGGRATMPGGEPFTPPWAE
jgi:quercetin dioxygenase-like cupin family protein